MARERATHLEKIQRVTKQTVDVVEVLVDAHQHDQVIHGWAIIKATKRTAPTVYNVLDRLEEMKWIKGEWEESSPDSGKPRRRLYRLTGEGVFAARNLLAEYRTNSKPTRMKQRPGFAIRSLARTLRLGGAR